jgi:20S proteasome subunit beta 1
MSLKFNGGLILAADTRTSAGTYISNRMTDKITPLFEDIFVCRSGTASDTQVVAGYVKRYLGHLRFKIVD